MSSSFSKEDDVPSELRLCLLFRCTRIHSAEFPFLVILIPFKTVLNLESWLRHCLKSERFWSSQLHCDTSSNDISFQAFAIFCGMGIHNTQMYEKVVHAMAKRQVALEVLSYHAAAPIEDVRRMTVSIRRLVMLRLQVRRIFQTPFKSG